MCKRLAGLVVSLRQKNNALIVCYLSQKVGLGSIEVGVAVHEESLLVNSSVLGEGCVDQSLSVESLGVRCG
ncbi:hypothetical protein GCM10008019_35900 [Deinococcus soli (ex Cha et al. 2016)]|nr:hypothetical protein GCM10008019_35900 [Deinococcus soli (ex Cha et al. 2016)]